MTGRDRLDRRGVLYLRTERVTERGHGTLLRTRRASATYAHSATVEGSLTNDPEILSTPWPMPTVT